MNFNEIARNRQSCRSYDTAREVEKSKLDAILESARLAPSACNVQPYEITVCKGDAAKRIAMIMQGRGEKKFFSDAPVLLVISEVPYEESSVLAEIVKKNDYISIDIGILSAYITAEATAQGLGTCIIGYIDGKGAVRAACGVEGNVRLVISVGYETEGYELREKKRKSMDVLVRAVD